MEPLINAQQVTPLFILKKYLNTTTSLSLKRLNKPVYVKVTIDQQSMKELSGKYISPAKIPFVQQMKYNLPSLLSSLGLQMGSAYTVDQLSAALAKRDNFGLAPSEAQIKIRIDTVTGYQLHKLLSCI